MRGRGAGQRPSSSLHRRRATSLLVKSLVAALVLAVPAPAGARPAIPQEDVEINAGDALSWKVGGDTIIFLAGQVRVRRGEVEMTAARALIWTRPGEKPAFRELYAEGNVAFRRGASKLRAERVYYNLVKDEAVIVDFKARGSSNDVEQFFYVTAAEVRKRAGRITAGEVKMSTCSYGVPHYHIEVGEAELIGRDRLPEGSGPFNLWPFKDWDVRVKRLEPKLIGAPVFFFPGLALGPWIQEFPVRSVKGGRTSNFGYYAYTDLGVTLRLETEDGKERTWGEVLGEVDWREERGGAYGLDLEYGWGNYTGFVDTYFLHDLGRKEDSDFERRLDPLKRAERGRARAFHRHELNDHFRLELETSYVSDRDLREEFFEKEFKEDKAPETAAYFRWLDGEAGAFLLSRHRLNDWQTQNEYLPRADFSVFQTPVAEDLLDQLLLTTRFDGGLVRRRFDKKLRLPTSDTWRWDSSVEVSWPWDLEVLQAAPFAAHRMTVYEDGPQGESEFRSLWSAGGRLVTQAHATFPELQWHLAGLRGLRHVAELEARYANNFDTTVAPSELFPFEEIDQLDTFEELAVELRQRFLTQDDEKQVFEFMSLTVGIEYYPDSDRDTTSFNANSYVFPFNWITLAPDSAGVFDRRHWSNVNYEISITPRRLLRFSAGGEYHPLFRHEEVREFAVSVTPLEGLTGTVGHTFVRGVTDAYAFDLAWAITPKWSVQSTAQYDFRIDEWLSQSLVVSRDFHDFLIEVVVDRDFGRDEHRAYVNFVPKIFRRKGLFRSAPPPYDSSPY